MSDKCGYHLLKTVNIHRSVFYPISAPKFVRSGLISLNYYALRYANTHGGIWSKSAHGCISSSSATAPPDSPATPAAHPISSFLPPPECAHSLHELQRPSDPQSTPLESSYPSPA